MKKLILILFLVFIPLLTWADLEPGPIIPEGDIESSVVVLSRDGKMLKVIGTPHFGTPMYWKNVYSDIAGLPVIHDNVKNNPRMMAAYLLSARILNVLYQGEVMDFSSPGWVCADIPIEVMNVILDQTDVDEQNFKLIQMLLTPRDRLNQRAQIIAYYNYVVANPEQSVIPDRINALMVRANATLGDCVILTGESNVPAIIRLAKIYGFEMGTMVKRYPLLR